MFKHNFMKKINIFIVHYNTPELTECLIKSINKMIPQNVKVTIYIFDNSDKFPFVYKQENIIYIDNTKKQIIDFSTWLENYKNRGKICYSAIHCYTIQTFIDKYNVPFILLDSDVLLKKDISELFDENLAFVGESFCERIVPFICFINPKILKENNVTYFDDRYMYNLNGIKKYDTGYMLLANKNKLPHKLIKYNDFIQHYTAGSYEPEAFNILHKGQISKKDWLEKYKQYWN